MLFKFSLNKYLIIQVGRVLLRDTSVLVPSSFVTNEVKKNFSVSGLCRAGAGFVGM